VLLVLWATGRLNGPAPSPGGGAPAAETGPDLPQTLRRDFGLKIEVLDSRAGPNGRRLVNAGEPATYRLEVERDAYVGIWNINPDGVVVQLFPNEYEPEHLVRAGKPRFLPGNDKYVIDSNATPPGKYEALHVVAATRRWDPLVGEKVGPFVVFRTPADRERFDDHLRKVLGSRDFVIRPKAPARPTQPADKVPQVAEEVLTYRVLPR
jgi:hypothetical protein